MLRFLASIALLVSVCLTLAATLSANVLVVAPSGGQFTQIQPAIDAAGNGDTILVKGGSYSGFAIVNRARLDVLADAGASVQVDGAVIVRDCPGYIVLSGLTVTAHELTTTSELHGLSLIDNTGPVRVMDCTFTGAPTAPTGSLCTVRHAALVQGSSNVEFASCTFFGSSVGMPSAGVGLACASSSIALYDSSLYGGAASCVACGYVGGDGGDGAVVGSNSFLFSSRSEFHGGRGANTGGFGGGTSADSGDGGDGVVVWGVSAVHLLDCITQGGNAGSTSVAGANCSCGCCSFCCSCWSDGFPGQATYVESHSSLAFLTGSGRTLSAPTVVRELQPAMLQIGGVPGDEVALSLSHNTGFTWQPAFRGVSLVVSQSTPARYLILGTIDPSGLLTYPITFPDLGAGVLASNYHTQTIHGNAQGSRWLGSGRTIVVLDSSL